MSHLGDPCIFCHQAMENVEVGPCPAVQGDAMYRMGRQELMRCAAGGKFDLLPLEALAVLQEIAALRHQNKALLQSIAEICNSDERDAQITELKGALRAMVETLDPDTERPVWAYLAINRGFGCHFCGGWLPWARNWDDIEHSEDCPVTQACTLLEPSGVYVARLSIPRG